ncbi:PP2C family protein-serine/threonine phosphatase [Actinoplanes aureus]|uniref:Serine/threonine-protein phosphatase n=1 Tax=Actinoplanes aureus TaxID=2792083 RepID=A0A931G6M0_9ACTN|nr:PP2C family protein-serine/threonine phosphatase [Actinoplanes aureus]MBG0567359.1 serine/threonine-protein phosphatase [Actinoplanes aureus]
MKSDQGPLLADILDAAENAAPVDTVDAVTRNVAVALGARTVSFLIADLSGRALVRLAHVPFGVAGGTRHQGKEAATVVPFDGGPAEQALRTQTVQVLALADGWTVLAPVTERGEVIGLLEMILPDEPSPDVLRDITRTAHALAFVVIANRRHTDLFEWGQRTTPFTLSAEIQRRLLPASFTCEASAFTLSGWLEPAASIGGDTFDYSLGRDVLHFSITDAMGHGVASALTATLGVGSLRNSRRRDAGLVEQATTANADLKENAVVPGSYITAILGRLDLRTGTCSLLNAGHVPPLLVRDGETREVPLPRNLALGMFAQVGFRDGEIVLRPGDRLALFTDGMRERKATHLDLSARLSEMTALHPREAVRAMADATLEVAGPVLADDATLLILDWHDGHSDDRDASAGADQARTSAAVPD